ncbi:sensor histidine kinase [Paucibacter sp. DJ2R-2]|uniref:sensor histidine kinase n=1 Tax=Paucibacter sp. DJ2R-2 TaxID=2893558 RepID=UPI0021E4D115|nr:histidine kinase [Paucibacter sp. DJ2R-2]MCV2420107.1 histidine kinase [Paucibacter sp. DJ4R-1]MCV2436966.1 histidine kinase [Paucibacter sp. DJ2R-2]
MSPTTPFEAAPLSPAFNWRALFGWRRVRTVIIICTLLTLLLNLTYASFSFRLPMRVFGTGLVVLLAFGLTEQWPRRLPEWLARWALQVVAVGLVVPVTVFLFYKLGTDAGAPDFWKEEKRLFGFMLMSLSGMLVAPWTALTALLRQREAKVEKQANDFELERSELARQALDARMRLLTAQAQPHFLFNTLANVQALVEAGSPRAPQLLQSLTDYLRAAVPRLDGSANTLGQELELVRAYLELMQMRMPDRLAFALHIGAGVHLLRCPPMTLLTLVENAVQHGIDPSEEGGRIDVHAELLQGGRCRLRVLDTGVGLQATGGGLGTGLAALRERLLWAYGGSASLELREVAPHGVEVTIEFSEPKP